MTDAQNKADFFAHLDAWRALPEEDRLDALAPAGGWDWEVAELELARRGCSCASRAAAGDCRHTVDSEDL